MACFNADVYEALGYFALFRSETDELLRTFDQKGICLRNAFERWRRVDPFLYTPNHPTVGVFVDIMVEAWSSHIGKIDRIGLDDVKATMHDELADSILWPVYPDIAERHGFDRQCVWLTSIVQGRERYELLDFVKRSYCVLSQRRDFGPQSVPEYEKIREVLRRFGL